MQGSEWPALVSGAEGLNRYPDAPEALRRRMAELYGVAPDQVLPTRGATHALELVLRAARLAGAERVAGSSPLLARLAAIYGLQVAEPAQVRVLASPSDITGEVLTAELARTAAAEIAPGLLVVDESAIEFAEGGSLAPLTGEIENMVVLRSLSLAYGLPGARCGAAAAGPALLARLEAVLEPHAIPAATLRAAEAVLSPSRALAVEGRVRLVREERARMAEALKASPLVASVRAGEGPFLLVEADPNTVAPGLARYGVSAERVGGKLRLEVSTPEANERALAAFGCAPAAAARRRGEAVRDTKETRIAATVDLDRAGETSVRTGVGFFDHMLEQVASHGGFSLRLACEGDLEIDPHHTVEDCSLALGAALRQALGDRAGIGRYGFVAPMDEAEAAVSLDLSGRPYAVFDGAFTAERIGDYPTALTSHVFRSLADSLGAAIHVRVTGSDDHHKTEVCFKALGRALRQAVRIEGGGVPSTKGVIA